ncbi:hypothetical protein PRUPE_1G455500 [Prunus persica]|uniref:Uncharacterized protein n=1 Tax=Prunus persica TaxID=3760 RepID=M5XND2_PRUPE|nr:hypothetical protein PRUPE_1G455500 [Prunus persica]
MNPVTRSSFPQTKNGKSHAIILTELIQRLPAALPMSEMVSKVAGWTIRLSSIMEYDETILNNMIGRLGCSIS